MSYREQIQEYENEIKELGEKLCETLVSIKQPYSSFLSFLRLKFLGNRYPAAIASLKWCIEEHQLDLPEAALELWVMIKNKADSASQLYVMERKSDNGYKDPFTHMNALVEAKADIPSDFGKRYCIDEGAVKCLTLTSPGYEERFIRSRIGEAIARNGSRSGHYIYAKRRYKLTEEQAKRLVDELWDNQDTVSKTFFEFLNRGKLVKYRLSKKYQEEVLQIVADFGMPTETI